MKPKLKQLNTLGDLSPAKWGYCGPHHFLQRRWACANSRNSNMGKTGVRLLYRGYFYLPVQVVLSGLQQTLLDRNHYCLRAVIGVQLTEDVFKVHLHGVLRNN
jgi:hypothetical protein